jgi:hypothetical protein|tara:strand:- start:2342 stop:2503 length:162 start_codon:yes stop_codon:yes gene_type:complete
MIFLLFIVLVIIGINVLGFYDDKNNQDYKKQFDFITRLHNGEVLSKENIFYGN